MSVPGNSIKGVATTSSCPFILILHTLVLFPFHPSMLQKGCPPIPHNIDHSLLYPVCH